MARFFIDRPIFAWVLALFISVLGLVAIQQLPISQYPPVAPPSVVISAAYPGASAQTLEDSVLQADQALYHAKADGRNRVHLLTPSPGTRFGT